MGWFWLGFAGLVLASDYMGWAPADPYAAWGALILSSISFSTAEIMRKIDSLNTIKAD